MTPSPASTIDQNEINHFQQFADTWWDESGTYAALHQMNPVRLGYIQDHMSRHFGKVAGISVLDVGCGGGLICEPMTRLGAKMTGVDACLENIECATAHASSQGLDIDYRHTAVEQVEESFDVVIASEIIEHVANPQAFIEACSKRLKPNGLLFISTLNRTHKSYLLGIIAAEHILRWAPKGTHDWNKFITPEELQIMLKAAGLTTADLAGMEYSPLRARWKLGDSDAINYIAVATSQEHK
ncbi:MAG: bifunctional 2-polyprenyl-6-hydroxyphenol methylase/3-demethylubiquinol 3-O-methyltransferase UbiG [Alphaproteobacteria bacterium]